MDKLANLGIDAHALFWITSSLTNQKQHVVVGRESSLDTPILSYFYFPTNVFVPQVNRHSYSSPLIHQPRAHTNAFQSSFVPSSVSVWNHLPHETLTAHSINSFKSLVAPLFL